MFVTPKLKKEKIYEILDTINSYKDHPIIRIKLSIYSSTIIKIKQLFPEEIDGFKDILENPLDCVEAELRVDTIEKLKELYKIDETHNMNSPMQPFINFNVTKVKIRSNNYHLLIGSVEIKLKYLFGWTDKKLLYTFYGTKFEIISCSNLWDNTWGWNDIL